MQVLVARIGRPHGLAGEVTVQVHTDAPQRRFAVGQRLIAEPGGELTIRGMRVHKGITLLAFEQARDRTAAEALRGTRLFAQARPSAPGDGDRQAGPGAGAGREGEPGAVLAGCDAGDGAGVTGDRAPGPGLAAGLEGQDAPPDGDEGWYEDELLGMRAFTPAGEPLGEVSGLLVRPAQDLLRLRLNDGREALVPFVDEIVPLVSIQARRIVIDPPEGLLDLAGS